MPRDDELTITEPSSMGALDGDRMGLVGMIVVGAVAIVAIVLAAVALSQGPAQININSGGATTSTGQGTTTAAGVYMPDPRTKVWTFAIGHDYSPFEYQNDQGYTDGFNLELISAVCKEAGVQCHLVYDSYANCWSGVPGKHPLPGEGLMGGWYDGCTGWTTQASRLNSVKFTTGWTQTAISKFMVQRGNPQSFNPLNLQGQTIGFLSGWVSDEHCVARQSRVTNNQLAPSQVKHYKQLEDAEKAIASREIIALFHMVDAIIDTSLYEFVGSDTDFSPCMIAGLGMMLKKDSTVDTWWNPAFDRIKENGVFRKICIEAPKKHAKLEEKVVCVQ